MLMFGGGSDRLCLKEGDLGLPRFRGVQREYEAERSTTTCSMFRQGQPPPRRCPPSWCDIFIFLCLSFAVRVLTSAQPRVTQFTGSSKVAEILVEALDGKVRRKPRLTSIPKLWPFLSNKPVCLRLPGG